jgi:hypothetical protein
MITTRTWPRPVLRIALLGAWLMLAGCAEEDQGLAAMSAAITPSTPTRLGRVGGPGMDMPMLRLSLEAPMHAQTGLVKKVCRGLTENYVQLLHPSGSTMGATLPNLGYVRGVPVTSPALDYVVWAKLGLIGWNGDRRPDVFATLTANLDLVFVPRAPNPHVLQEAASAHAVAYVRQHPSDGTRRPFQAKNTPVVSRDKPWVYELGDDGYLHSAPTAGLMVVGVFAAAGPRSTLPQTSPNKSHDGWLLGWTASANPTPKLYYTPNLTRTTWCIGPVQENGNYRMVVAGRVTPPYPRGACAFEDPARSEHVQGIALDPAWWLGSSTQAGRAMAAALDRYLSGLRSALETWQTAGASPFLAQPFPQATVPRVEFDSLWYKVQSMVALTALAQDVAARSTDAEQQSAMETLWSSVANARAGLGWEQKYPAHAVHHNHPVRREPSTSAEHDTQRYYEHLAAEQNRTYRTDSYLSQRECKVTVVGTAPDGASPYPGSASVARTQRGAGPIRVASSHATCGVRSFAIENHDNISALDSPWQDEGCVRAAQQAMAHFIQDYPQTRKPAGSAAAVPVMSTTPPARYSIRYDLGGREESWFPVAMHVHGNCGIGTQAAAVSGTYAFPDLVPAFYQSYAPFGWQWVPPHAPPTYWKLDVPAGDTRNPPTGASSRID